MKVMRRRGGPRVTKCQSLQKQPAERAVERRAPAFQHPQRLTPAAAYAWSGPADLNETERESVRKSAIAMPVTSGMKSSSSSGPPLVLARSSSSDSPSND
eukprot:1394794-Pleurochrysis_carterae.AAC.1